MSKTGGGIGTNQYKIRGTSQARKADPVSGGESSVTLAAGEGADALRTKYPELVDQATTSESLAARSQACAELARITGQDILVPVRPDKPGVDPDEGFGIEQTSIGRGRIEHNDGTTSQGNLHAYSRTVAKADGTFKTWRSKATVHFAQPGKTVPGENAPSSSEVKKYASEGTELNARVISRMETYTHSKPLALTSQHPANVGGTASRGIDVEHGVNEAYTDLARTRGPERLESLEDSASEAAVKTVENTIASSLRRERFTDLEEDL